MQNSYALVLGLLQGLLTPKTKPPSPRSKISDSLRITVCVYSNPLTTRDSGAAAAETPRDAAYHLQMS